MTLNLATTFKPAFEGGKNVYLYGANAIGTSSGWHDRGDWTVPGTAATVTAVSATPSGGSGIAQTFALQYSNTLGAADIAQAWVWISAAFGSNAANSCMVYYNRPSNTLFLLNNAGTAWEPAILGQATTLQNNQCSIDVSGSTAVLSGNTLTLNLDVTFRQYSGTKQIYMYGSASGGANSGWQTRGSWVVP